MKKVLTLLACLLISVSIADGGNWQNLSDIHQEEEFFFIDDLQEDEEDEFFEEETIWTAEKIIDLIIQISLEEGVPPNFVVAIALTENSALCPIAVGHNRNGTRDLGIMQLNDRYFSHVDWQCPEANIRAGVRHIYWLMTALKDCTWWSVAVGYNAGLSRVGDPPEATLDYAEKVLTLYHELSDGYARPFVYFPRR